MMAATRIRLGSSQRELYCVLTEEEFRARAEELAQEFKAQEALIEKNKGIKALLREQEAAAKDAVREMSRVVADGRERRSVDCAWVADFKLGLAECIRLDTGEVVEARKLTADDRQLALDNARDEDLPPVLLDPIRPVVDPASADDPHDEEEDEPRSIDDSDDEEI